ncbi:MAG: hypothetical protein IPP51_03500 [Bacteroidetes bacterium]|nr:hypothetical protein [Bacteroidota bacterium]
MKIYFTLLAFFVSIFVVKAQDAEMDLKQYYFVILVKGANRTQDSATVAKIQEGHLANITRLYEEGKIDLAGPFADDTDWRGIFIFNVESKEEVIALLKTDPAIAAGRLDFIIHPWYGKKGTVLR